MSFLGDAVVFILSGYLAFTNMLAAPLVRYFEEPASPPSIIASDAYEPELARVDSEYGTHNPIPKILIDNAAYQQAALYESQNYPGATTDDPREALVNIYCTRLTEDYIRTTTGTGFFVHPDGVIMTNAHVAQFLLMEGVPEFGEVECLIRTGDPAVPRYEVELLYIPPSWVQQHADQIRAEHPSGTGERDYALLYVTRGLNDQPLPTVFPALQVDPALLPRTIDEATVYAAGYPAQALFNKGPDVLLVPRLATSTISELYTFGSNYADLFSIRGSEIGQQGSSGGPIIGPNGEVIGMISTRGDDTVDGTGSLRAITTSHIDRTIKEETGYSLKDNVQGDLPVRAKLFNDTLSPFLSRILTQQLERVE